MHRLCVTLEDVEPAVWRTLLVASDTTLGHLHGLLQAAMGWHDTHLHHFVVGTTIYGPGDRHSGYDRKSERTVTLADVAPRVGDRIVYEYDFGDGWVHAIEVEEIVDAGTDGPSTRCVAGARACPPEDCGGPSGYEELLGALRDIEHPDHAEVRQWLGRPYDPEGFDLESANKRLSRRSAIGRSRRARA